MCGTRRGGGLCEGRSPVDPPVVVVSVKELDLLKGLLAGVVTGQVWMHAQEQVERCGPWGQTEREEQRTFTTMQQRHVVGGGVNTIQLNKKMY